MPRKDTEERRKYAREYIREYRKKFPEKVKEQQANYWRNMTKKGLNRNRQLKCRYGITEKEYDEMLIGQGNSCAICNAQSAYLSGKGKLFVDHDHIDGVVRGLLCNKCNTIIANVEELFGNLDKLKRVLEYLKIKADKFPG